MKKVKLYRARVSYFGYVYDLSDQKFRDLIDQRANIMAEDSCYKTIYISDQDANNMDGHFNYVNIDTINKICVKSWAEIDKTFNWLEIKQELQYIYDNCEYNANIEHLIDFLNTIP